jgi:hypothetical protein
MPPSSGLSSKPCKLPACLGWWEREGDVFRIVSRCMTILIHIAERLLAEFSKMTYSCFCIENSMAAILVCLECTNLYFPVLLPPPQMCALKFILCFKSFFRRGIYGHLQHSDIKPIYCRNKST